MLRVGSWVALVWLIVLGAAFAILGACDSSYGESAPAAAIVEAGTSGADVDADAVPSTIQVDPISAKEGSGTPSDFVFNVRLDRPSSREVTVDYFTNDETAKSPDDYVAATGKIVFPVGSTSQPVTVKVTGDRFEEPDETFVLKLANPVGANLAAVEAKATIQNDDSPGLSIEDLDVTEADTDSTANVIVTLSGTYTTEVTASYVTNGGTAKPVSDFISTSGTVTFAPGETTKTITIPIKGDLANEPEESFTVSLTNVVGTTIVKGDALVKITDNDAQPLLSIANTTIGEGDVGVTNLTFTVTLSAASAADVMVSFATGGGTASAADYAATSGTLTFPAGTTSRTISVPVNGDSIDEPDETLVVTLSLPVNAALGTATATGTITDDDAPPTLTVGNVALAEGNAGTKTFSFPFTLSTASAKTITIAYATANGTATAGTDYTSANGTVTFMPGETSKTVDVVVAGDAVAEGAETFTVNLTNPVNVTAPLSPATGTIVNDDGAAANLSIGDASVAEGNAGTKLLTFTVSCTGTGTGITVDYSTTNGTATSGSDYVTKTGTLGPFNCTASQTIDVTINGDNTFEPDESFTVNLSNPSADVAIVDSQGAGTITNDDSLPTINIASVTAAEGNIGAPAFGFEVTLTNPASTVVTVNYATSAGVTNPATAGTDYTTTSGTLSFSAGETTKTINVSVNGDVTYEANETFRVTLSANSANSTLGTAVGTGTITNDDTAPTLSINDVTLNEGNSGSTSFTFTVTLSGPTDTAVSVNYATSDGTATAGTDYTSKTGTVTIPAGSLSTTITVVGTGDTLSEPTETFNVTLSTPVGASIADAVGVGTITNDDQVRLLTINDVSAVEGNTLTFTVSLTPGSNGTTTVQWSLVDVTTSANDHGATTSGTLSFSSGQTSKTISITTTGDTLDEIDETFEIRLSNVVGDAQISDDRGVGTITDNDATPSVSIAGPGAFNEGDSGSMNVTFTVTLSAVSGRTVTVQYATRDGTASSSGANKDYTATSGTLTFQAGETTKQVLVAVFGDNTNESNENFFMDLSNPIGATIGNGTSPASITDDD